MKIILYATLFLSTLYCAQALTCWVCENMRSNDECIMKGRPLPCQMNEHACHISVRRGDYGILLTKRCKQGRACDNNFIQNPRAAWAPSQCNARIPSSVCRCCCTTDLCNRNYTDCRQGDSGPRGPPNPICDPLPPPQNGRKVCTLGGNVIGVNDDANVTTECRFSCNEGYRLAGSDVSICDLNPLTQEANFNRNTPICRPSTCFIRQVAPSNGNVICTNINNLESICSFDCDEGYELMGSPAITCLVSRVWTDRPPTCKRMHCTPRHFDPRNGQVTCDDDNNLFSTCRFECNRGFAIEGPPQSFCARSPSSTTGADWTNDAPECLPIRCIPQDAPQNGGISCSDGVNLESVCSFTCNDGYTLNGNDAATCFDDLNDDQFGQWTSPPPICEHIFCQPQLTPLNGGQSCTNGVNLQSVCTFTCDAGYVLDGSDTAECFDDRNNDNDGAWTAPPPVCLPIACIPQAAPLNGGQTCTNNAELQSVCTFTCNENYVLIGSDTAQCFDDGNNDVIGEWTAQPPVCRPISCEVQTAPENGAVLCSRQNNLGSNCAFSCNEGYRLDGIDSTLCIRNGQNGEWTSPPPTCQLIECPTLNSPPNGKVSCTQDSLFNSVCSFECDASRNFTLFPQEQRDLTCQRNSEWNKDPPCCALPCPPYAVMDLLLILDSSSSIGDPNWITMKRVIRQFIERFDYSANFTRLAVFRYNRDVDSRSQILFNSFLGDREGMLRAFDRIPYDGSGTHTGKAVEYAKTSVLLPELGDRSDVQNVAIVITDGRAQDGDLLRVASQDLRDQGALTYAVGIEPPRGGLDENQLLEIGGEPDHVLIAKEGFSGLGKLLEERLSSEVCQNRCS